MKQNCINYDLLKRTNKGWNDGKYNSQQVVGSIMGFIKKFDPKSKRELIDSYYKSGEEREVIAKKKYSDCPIDLCDPTAVRKAELQKLNYHTDEIFALNNDYGRTEEYIVKLSEDFAKDQNLDENTALQQTMHRLFTETFRGAFFENEVCRYLNRTYPFLNFRKADSYEDSHYAVDLIAEKDGDLSVGVQIKPLTYLAKESFQHKENKEKNDAFERDTHKKVIYAFYKASGLTEDTWNTDFVIVSHDDQKLLNTLK